MTTSQQWLDLAHKASDFATELVRIKADLRLQLRKLDNQVDGLLALEEQCKLEADKDQIALEEVQFDAWTEEQKDEIRRGN